MMEMLLHKVSYISTKKFVNLLPFTNYQGLWGVNLRYRTHGQKRFPHANVNAGTAAGKVDKLQALTLEIFAIFHFIFINIYRWQTNSQQLFDLVWTSLHVLL